MSNNVYQLADGGTAVCEMCTWSMSMAESGDFSVTGGGISEVWSIILFCKDLYRVQGERWFFWKERAYDFSR